MRRADRDHDDARQQDHRFRVPRVHESFCPTRKPYVAGGIAEATVDSTSMPGAFSDFDGGVLFGMLAGSVTLLDMTFFFQEPIGDVDSRHYTRTIIPAPILEPTSAIILFTGLLFAGSPRRPTAKLPIPPVASPPARWRQLGLERSPQRKQGH
ncbi:MAG TPA: hypothetical protein VGK58_16135 [Lacipirellulaceae bacterium]